MALDYRALANASEREMLIQLLTQQDKIMSKQDEIVQELAEVKANLESLTESEEKAQTDLTSIKTAVLSTVPALQAQVATLQAANADQATLIDTFNADDVLTQQALSELKAKSAAASAAGDAIEAAASEILAVVQPPVQPT